MATSPNLPKRLTTLYFPSFHSIVDLKDHLPTSLIRPLTSTTGPKYTAYKSCLGWKSGLSGHPKLPRDPWTT